MTRTFITLFGLVLIATACNAAPTTRPPDQATTRPSDHALLKPGDYDRALTHAGRERTYTVHLPRGIGDEHSYSLVIVLHGGGGNDDNAARMTGFSALADKEEFIVVYPNGTGRLQDRILTWNAGNCCGYALDNTVDDVGFIRALIEQLQREYPINPQRIYATGISNGGMMSYRLACELSDQLAAIAPVAGALNVECKPAQPVAVIAFHGTADQHVLYNGGVPKIQADSHPREDKSVAYAMSFWVKQNQCNTLAQKSERGKVSTESYTSCRNNADVTLFTLKDFGHAWPRGARGTVWADDPKADISATDVMWEFFKQHPKP
ncbi:MAG: polyhydroxybutyrate depolymerase [Chloroflexi bacterium]|nr:polyhydroxybutyrate depolymerase [Chloroflexota bacterium]